MESLGEDYQRGRPVGSDSPASICLNDIIPGRGWVNIMMARNSSRAFAFHGPFRSVQFLHGRRLGVASISKCCIDILMEKSNLM